MYRQRLTEKTKLLEELKRRYLQRGKEGKCRLLDEFCDHYGYERKYAIKLLGDKLPASITSVHRGPQPKYGPV